MLSTIDAAGYTYLEVTQNKKTIWLAGPKVAAKKGDVIRFENGMVMTNFENAMKSKAKFKSDAFEAIHSATQGLRRAGTIDKATMREFDESCLTVPPVIPPEESSESARGRMSANLCSRAI